VRVSSYKSTGTECFALHRGVERLAKHFWGFRRKTLAPQQMILCMAALHTIERAEVTRKLGLESN